MRHEIPQNFAASIGFDESLEPTVGLRMGRILGCLCRLKKGLEGRVLHFLVGSFRLGRYWGILVLAVELESLVSTRDSM